VVVLLCIAVGAVVLWRTGRSGERLFGTSLLLFWIALPLAVRLFPGVLQYDGMRHVFIVVPPLLVLAAIGFQAVLTAVSERRRLAIVSAPIVGIVAAWLVWQNVQAHPHQASYLNEAVRTALPPEKLGSYFDFHGWGTPLHHAVNWLNLDAPEGATIHVTNMRSLLSQYDLRADLVVVSSGPADFIMFPSWRGDYMESYTSAPLFSVRCFGADLLLIHEYHEPSDNEEETNDAG
jgi:hypothetical protein